MKRMKELVCSAVRGAGELVSVILPLVVAAGVSVPASAGDAESKRRQQREERVERDRLRESRGQRGHVRRRSDVIDKRSHVEKREGWRRVE